MVKLSQQREVTPLQSRPTRTQRVLVRQEELRKTKEGVRDLAEFNRLKAQAEQLQQTEFSNIQSVDEYQQKYNLLNPNLKPFFSTPDQLKQTQVERIETTKTKIQEKIITAQQKKKEVELAYRQHLEWLSQNNRSDDDADDDWSEDEAYYNNYIRGLDEGLGKLNANQDVAYGDILGYASELGHYYKDRQEARNEGRRIEQRELAKLEGTQPFLIQEIESGKVMSEKIAFQDPTTKAFVSSMPLSTSLRSIAGLEKSSLGRTEIIRTFELGAEKHEFILRPQLYKTPSGKLTTELGGLSAKTESQIIKESQDFAYKDWTAKRKDKPIYVDYKAVDIKLPYTQRGTINELQSAELQPIVYPEYEKTDFKIISSLKRIWDKIPSGDWYYNPPKLFGIGGGISLFKTSDRSISLRESKKKFKGYLNKQSLDLVQDELTQTGIGEKLETKYQKESQLRFEDKYMKSLIYDEINYEDAVKEFEKSEDYKIIQKKYGEDVQLERSKLGFTKTGFKVAGLQFGKLGVTLIPTTTKGAIGEGVLIYTGYKALKLASPTFINSLTAGFGLYGGYKAFSPKSLPEERASGLIIAGISAGSLGLQAVRYLNKPTIKAVDIKPPKATLRASEVIGKDVKVITDKGVMNKVLYQEQKLSQVGVAGRRTIVSTKLRNLLKLDPIYKGVPYAHKSYFVKGLRSSYVYQTPSGYQKAIDLLMKRGGYDVARKISFGKLTKYKASQTLKYIQPKVIEQYLMKGKLTIKGTKAIGEFEYLTKQPVIDINKALGIKTRGARAIRDYFDIERKLINLKSGQNIALQETIRSSYFLKRLSSPHAFKDFQVSRGVIFGKTSGVKKGWNLKSEIKGIKEFKEIQYKDLFGVSLSKNVFPSDKILRLDISRSKLIGKLIDMRTKGYGVKVIGAKKTPLSKTFALEKQIKVQSIKKIIKRSDATTKYVSSTSTKQIEQDILKQSVSLPDIKTTAKIKDIIKVSSKARLSIKAISNLGLVGMGAIKLKSPQQTRVDLNTELKQLLYPRTKLKISQTATTIQSQVLKQQLKQALREPTINLPIVTPRFNIPQINVTTPTIPIHFDFPAIKSPKGRKKKLKKTIQDLLYLPDFTSRALGLEAETITEAQARKKLKKLLSGFEIRRPVKIKG